MKKLLFFLLLFAPVFAGAQLKPFRFAFISDTHIGSPNGSAEEDLRRSIRDINGRRDIAFVVLTGDITELGTNEELLLARKILDSLAIPYYIIPGNHDTGWSESGGVMFTTVFGYDKFSFEHHGIRFLGCASGPYVRMSDGHVPRDAVNWLDEELKKLKPGQPVIFLNHYPIDNGLDNWYEVTDRLRRHNTLAVLCGHGHSNRKLNFEDIPGVMGRSNLRARAPVGGYNIVDVGTDSISFTEVRPGTAFERQWAAVSAAAKTYDTGKEFPRPDYSVNASQGVVAGWTYSSDANIISTPGFYKGSVIVGNQNGRMMSLPAGKGGRKWEYQTGGAIFSSPVISGSRVVFGSGDGNIYCLDAGSGKLIWKKETGASVLGSPIVSGDTVFVGGSDHGIYAINIRNGSTIWRYEGLDGPVVSKPLLYDGKLIIGAWDRNLYAIQRNSGALAWKWNNGSTVRNYSPAACIPVAHEGIVYVVAPDRFISAIDATDGKTVWRDRGGVRESLGISEDGKWIYGKTMQDTIVAYATGREGRGPAWKMHCGFGYEHVPSMLIEKSGLVYFGTKSGVVYCINPVNREVEWQYKIDNSMVNTVNVIDAQTVLASTMDGKLVLLKRKPVARGAAGK